MAEALQLGYDVRNGRTEPLGVAVRGEKVNVVGEAINQSVFPDRTRPRKREVGTGEGVQGVAGDLPLKILAGAHAVTVSSRNRVSQIARARAGNANLGQISIRSSRFNNFSWSAAEPSEIVA
jgi:hypothetical protein